MKNLDASSLEKEVNLLKKELFNLKLSSMTGQVKDFSQFKKLRINIARAQTYLNAKKRVSKIEPKKR